MNHHNKTIDTRPGARRFLLHGDSVPNETLRSDSSELRLGDHHSLDSRARPVLTTDSRHFSRLIEYGLLALVLVGIAVSTAIWRSLLQ
jgi:hypothetical protein